MDFSLTEEQKAVREAARDFAEQVLLPGVLERDEQQSFPRELVQQMGEQGFLGMMTDPAWNGSGLDSIAYVSALEEISKVEAAAGVIMSVNNSLVCWGLEHYGSDEQKEKYLSKLTTGEALGAFCLSEPEAGSDATKLKTTAEKQGDHYIINGAKNWITNGGSADFYIVFAQSDASKGAKGINAFVVEKGTEGFDIGPKEHKLGIRASDTHSLNFNNVKVSETNRIGEEGKGMSLAFAILEGGRLGIAAQALGIASGAYERALAYSQERQTFGQPIANHQAIQFKLADMATRIAASRDLIYKAASLKDQGQSYGHYSSMAKLYASETAMYVASEAIQIHGGYGYVKEYHVERMLRDAKITQIYEGTSEIQRIIISRKLLE